MTRLYRPVGLFELVRITELGFHAFPPRLAEQPIFYPVLERPYAEEIASRWNPPDPNSGYAGFVTAFDVQDAAVARYPVQIAGADRHRELWIPAEEQASFQQAFEGPIVVLAGWAGPRLATCLPSYTGGPGPLTETALAGIVAAVARGEVRGGPQTEGEQA